MDIDALKKLNELKEQGILTQEEFDKQKGILLNNETNNKILVENKKGGWKNFVISFFIGILILISCLICFLCVVGGAFAIDTNTRNIGSGLGFIAGIFMAIVSFSVRSGKYKNCSSGWGVFFTIWVAGGVFGPLGAGFGILFALYQFFKIKSGEVVLRETK